LDPAHRKCERETNQVWGTRNSGKKDAQDGDVTSPEPDAVESIGNVNLGDVDMAKAGVSMENARKEAMESAAKLHGLGRGINDGVLIDRGKSVVNNGTGTAIVLGDDAQRTESEVGQLRHQRGRKNCPVLFEQHGCKFLTEESNVVFGGFVAATACCSMLARRGPRKVAHGNGSPKPSQVVEKRSSWVREGSNSRRKITGHANAANKLFPGIGRKIESDGFIKQLTKIIWKRVGCVKEIGTRNSSSGCKHRATMVRSRPPGRRRLSRETTNTVGPLAGTSGRESKGGPSHKLEIFAGCVGTMISGAATIAKAAALEVVREAHGSGRTSPGDRRQRRGRASNPIVQLLGG